MIRNGAMTYLRTIQQGIMTRRRPDRITLMLIALSLLAGGFVLLRAWLNDGLGLNGISLAFIALGRNILAGNGLVEILTTDSGGLEPSVLWPPLYSFVLAALSFGVFDLYDVATPLNAATFGLTVFAVSHYLRRFLQSRLILLLVVLAVASSLPLIWITSIVMSEALFVLLATLALIQCHKFLDEGKTSSLIWAAVFAALAWQTRFIGLALPATIGILILLQRDVALLHRARRIFAFSLIVVFPMVLYAIHYISAIGVSRRTPVDYSLPDLVDNIGDALSAAYERILLLPFIGQIPVAAWVGIAVLLMALAGVLVAILWQARRSADWPRRPITVFGGFALVYTASVIGAVFSGLTLDGFEVRYFVPIWIPALMVAALMLDTMLGMITKGRISGMLQPNAARGATAVLTAILCLFTAAMLTITALDTRQVKTSGISFISALSVLDVIQHVEDNPVYDVIYSNAPFAIYWYTDGTREYRMIPPSHIGGGYAIDNRFAGISGSEQLHRWAAELPEGVYVVWLYDYYINHVYDFGPAEMRASPRLEVAADLADGVIFRAKGQPE